MFTINQLYVLLYVFLIFNGVYFKSCMKYLKFIIWKITNASGPKYNIDLYSNQKGVI